MTLDAAAGLIDDAIATYQNDIDDGKADLWTSDVHAALFAIDILIDILYSHLRSSPLAPPEPFKPSTY